MKTISLLAVSLTLAAAVSAQTFLANYNAKIKSTADAIKASKLAPALQNDFQNKLAKIQEKACAPATAKCNPSPEKVEEALDAMGALSDDLAAAVKADGTQTLPQLYAPKLAALTAELNAAKIKVDENDRRPLDTRISEFTKKFLASAGSGAVTGKPRQDLVQQADDAFSKLKDDVDAAVALAADKSNSVGFLTALQAKAKKVQAAINASKLDAAFKLDFNEKLNKITSSVCTAASMDAFAGLEIAAKSKTACPKATASVVEAADGKLDELSAALTQAIADDGTKGLGVLYAPKITALEKALTDAKLPDADNRTLTARLKAFKDSLTMSELTKTVQLAARTHGDPVQDIADKYQKLSDDITAAAALAKEKGESAGFMAAFETKANTLQKKIDATKLNASFKQDFSAKLAAIGATACGAKTAAGQAVKCVGATPSKLEAADGQLSALSDAVDDAVKNLGTQDLTAVYKDKVAALQTALQTGGIDTTDLRALQGRLTSFKILLTSKPGPGQDLVTKVSDAYDALKADVDAAVAMSKTSKSGKN